MKRRIAEFLFCDPGGWPRFSKADVARSVEEEKLYQERLLRQRPKLSGASGAFSLLFLLLILLGDGLKFGLQLFSMLALPLLALFPAAFLRPVLLQGLPANHACAWPMDLKSDRRRSYIGTVLTASTIWLVSILVFLGCIMMMKSGMGDQWNPFTRTVRIVKGGPYSEYGLIEMFMFISGFFAVTGLLWWPMIIFFEWLETRKPGNGNEGARFA